MIEKRSLDACLRGISFPADGSEIAECISGNSCPPDLRAQLLALPPHRRFTEESLHCELGDPVYCS